MAEAPVPDADHQSPPPPSTLDYIATALRGLQFGEVTITVRDGVVIQIERIERTRLPRGARRP